MSENPLLASANNTSHLPSFQAASLITPLPHDDITLANTDVGEVTDGLQNVDLQTYQPPTATATVVSQLPSSPFDNSPFSTITTTTPGLPPAPPPSAILPPAAAILQPAATFQPPATTTTIPFSTAVDTTQPHLPVSFENMAAQYHPVLPHWFYRPTGKNREWRPFSFPDSFSLEEAFLNGDAAAIPVEGGRYDVKVLDRIRIPVYWEEEAEVQDQCIGIGGKEDKGGEVRRCSWFRKGPMDALPVPYTEQQAAFLEDAYKRCVLSGSWHKQIDQADGSRVVLHSPRSMVHYTSIAPDSEFPTGVSVNGSQAPLTVRRGTEDFEIEDGESDQVDHLMLVVHGIGSVCDLRLRPVHQCVEDFRSLGRNLLSSHFREAVDRGEVGRVEILPISWHKALHGDATGLDARLRPITLRSIPKLREFTNDTILDALLFTSPIYCQHIIDTVVSEMERLYSLYKQRNPEFCGKVSVAGHSLGSVILFDILSNQKEGEEEEEEKDISDATPGSPKVEYVVGGGGGTGQPSLRYPQLSFHPQAFFLLGSPISMFVTVRGIESIGRDFRLPTCPSVLNIFHPFDPVAYRLEALIDPELSEVRPVLIPHHKGRKRMHLELKDTLERVGSDLRQKIVESIQGTWNKLYQYYAGEPKVEQLEHLLAQQGEKDEGENEGDRGRETDTQMDEASGKFGELNGGRRIDYVLQEKPYESFNEYIFALQAHLTYWESEDTMLLILKELYGSQNILPDVQRQPESPTSPTSAIQSPSTEFPTNQGPVSMFAPPAAQPALPPEPVPLLSASSFGSFNSMAPPPSSVIPSLPPSSLPPSSPPSFLPPSSIPPSSLSLSSPPTLPPSSLPPTSPPSFLPPSSIPLRPPTSLSPPRSSSLPPSSLPAPPRPPSSVSPNRSSSASPSLTFQPPPTLSPFRPSLPPPSVSPSLPSSLPAPTFPPSISPSLASSLPPPSVSPSLPSSLPPPTFPPSISPSLSSSLPPPSVSPSLSSLPPSALPPSISPSLSSPLSPPSLPPSISPSLTTESRVIGGRPVALPPTQAIGMDPTVRPTSQGTVGPPPKMMSGNLNRKINPRR